MVLPRAAPALPVGSSFDHIQCKCDLKVFVTWHIEKFKTLRRYSLHTQPWEVAAVISGQPDLTKVESPDSTPLVLCSGKGDTSGRERREEVQARDPVTSKDSQRRV